MDLKALTQELGISTYPDRVEEIFNSTELNSTSLIDMDELLGYHKNYCICGDYLDAVIRGGEAILANKSVLAWGNIAVKYLSECKTAEEARALTIPELDGTPERDLLPFYLWVKEIPRCIRMHSELGMNDDIIRTKLRFFPLILNIGVKECGRPAIRYRYFKSAFLSIYPINFSCGKLAFERRPNMDYPVIVLKHKETGELKILADGVRVHRSGCILGSVDALDEDGAFTAELTETESEFIGHPASDKNGYQRERISLKKSEWNVFFRRGDSILSVHIPRNTDLSDKAIDETFAEAKKFFERYFPKDKYTAIMCFSWLLNPILEDILGEHSNLVKFEKRFEKFPYFTKSNDFLCFIYPDSYDKPTQQWPENTTLQKKIKELYLSGGRLHEFGGILKI